LNQQVTALLPTDDGGWRVETSLGNSITARCVIIAAGVGAFGPNRPPLDGLDAYEGKSVFYLVKKRQDFAGKRVVIAGGGDSAVDWAVSLAEVAASVAVVHRRDKFRAAPDMVARMQELSRDGKVDLVTPYQLAGLEGADGMMTGVVVETLDGDKRTLPADAMLAFFGLSMNLGPVAEWGLDLDKHHIAVDPATCGTNRPGIFAIGDVATYKNKLKLILTGFAEAATAAHAIHPIARPGEVLHFEYSTTKGAPSVTG
jgi:thioredoxin reductase (NADPH)